MTIVFDFDYTLYNTARLVAALQSIATRFGISSGVSDAITEALLLSAPFDHRRHSALVAGYKNIDGKLMHRLYNAAIEQSGFYLYEDVFASLEALKEAGHSMVVLSFGNDEFQRLKIKASGIMPFLDDVIVVGTSSNKHQVSLPFEVDEHTVFINDHASENESLQRQYPKARVLQMVRPNAVFEASSDQEVIHSLSELNEILKQ